MNPNEESVGEKVFEVVWYSVLLFLATFFINRFGNSNWAPLYPFSSIAICIFIAHIGLSISQVKEWKLWLRIGLPAFGLLLIWHRGDFTLGIVNSFQESFHFLEFIIFCSLVFISLIFTLQDSVKVPSGKPAKQFTKSVSGSKSFNDIIGQDHVIDPLKEIARLAAAKVKVGKENAPYAVLMFLGPTGVGKTEAARALAQAVYGSQDALIRFDMGQFSDAHQASRFYGPPPGYVGFEQGGQLTRAVLKRPRSVVLLDEVEKADNKIWDAFLPVFDEGYIVDGSSNQKVDMSETIIVLTSNLLSNQIELLGKNGLEIKEALQKTGTFRPELIGRINEILIFKSLDTDTIREILQRRVDNALWGLSEQGIPITINPSQIDEMVLEIQAAKFGVRQIDDVLRTYLRKLISNPSGSDIEGYKNLLSTLD